MKSDPFITENGVVLCEPFRSLEGVIHGFSTRLGGVSTLPHTESLNLGFGRGDPDGTVRRNLLILRDKLGIGASDALVSAHQVHSDRVVYADGSTEHFDGVDGFVTDVPGVYLLVKVADCQPILFADPEARVVGACHAGWRGTVAGIAEKTVSLMEAYGADRRRVLAALGPCIGVCCFEVGEDFYEAVKAAAPELLRFVYSGSVRLYADLREMNRHVLLSAGLSENNIFVSGECTCCDAEKFFSHRRTHGVRGTMAGVIGLKKENGV